MTTQAQRIAALETGMSTIIELLQASKATDSAPAPTKTAPAPERKATAIQALKMRRDPGDDPATFYSKLELLAAAVKAGSGVVEAFNTAVDADKGRYGIPARILRGKTPYIACTMKRGKGE